MQDFLAQIQLMPAISPGKRCQTGKVITPGRPAPAAPLAEARGTAGRPVQRLRESVEADGDRA
jgi:hypothetical protein